MSWWDSNWLYKRELTIENSGIGTSQTGLFNFPVLIKLTPARVDYSKVKSAGEDLRFLTSGEDTVLDYEIESYVSGGDSIVWARVPVIPPNGQPAKIWMYYGNSSASDAQNKTGVWINGYEAVYHLSETTGKYYDSRGYGHDSRIIGPETIRTGLALGLGYGPYFNGATGAHIIINNSVGYQLTGFDFNNFTLEAMVIPSGSGVAISTGTGGVGAYPIIGKGIGEAESVLADVAFLMGVGANAGYSYRLATDLELRRGPTFGESQSENSPWSGGFILDSLGRTTYHFVSMVSGKTWKRHFIDGGLTYSGVITGFPSTGGGHHVGIGASTRASTNPTIQGNFKGWIDEVRFSRVTRDEIWVDHTNRSNRDQLITYGSEQENAVYTGVYYSITGQASIFNNSIWQTINGIGNIKNTTTYNQSGLARIYVPSSGWWNTDWSYKRKITINNNFVTGEALTDFPVLVIVNSSNFTLTQFNTGADARFIDSGESIVLDHELEDWNAAGNSLFWVKIPYVPLSGQEAYFWMYWGNQYALPSDNPTGVWSNKYRHVFHLNETSNNYSDSTAYANHGTGVDVTSRTAVGFFGNNTPEFDAASADKILAGISSSGMSGDMTIFAIAKLTSAGTRPIIQYGLGGEAQEGNVLYGLETDASNYLWQQWESGGGTNTTVGSTSAMKLNEWADVAAAREMEGSIVKWFISGTHLQNTSFGAGPDGGTTAFLGIGQRNSSAQYWDGYIDEVRVEEVVRSDPWLRGQSYSVNNTLLSFGDSETRGNTYQTISGIASILSASRKDINGLAYVAREPAMDIAWVQFSAPESEPLTGVSYSIQGLASIGTSATTRVYNQSGQADIRTTTVYNQLGQGDIRKTTVYNQSGQADVRRTTVYNQSGRADIRNAFYKTQQGVARISSASTTTTAYNQSGKSAIRVKTARNQQGRADIFRIASKTIQGIAYMLAGAINVREYNISGMSSLTPPVYPGKPIYVQVKLKRNIIER